jgi:hypothetical protein
MPSAPITPPATVADFKATFTRGFKYATGPDGVMDSDIQTAIGRAVMLYNPCLFTPSEGKTAFLLAVAHFVVVGIQAAGGLFPQMPGPAGAAGAPGASADATRNTGSGVIGTKTTEKVTIQYAGLEKLMERFPTLAPFRQTDFGAQYAMIVGPRLMGRVTIAPGPTPPDAVIPAVPFLG